jgi:2-hydroxy-6-oxonona-2,4-dienedioate hydrolase
VWDYFLRCSGAGRIAACARQALLLDRLEPRPLLPEVRQPVLLVCGDRDPVVPGPYAEALLRGLPNARLAVLEGGGRLPSYTHPEVLAEVVRQFLTPPPAG